MAYYSRFVKRNFEKKGSVANGVWGSGVGVCKNKKEERKEKKVKNLV
jgi:hypothetical protein